MTIEERKATLLAELAALGVSHIIAEYSGSGDDGQIDGVYAYIKGNDKPVEFETLRIGRDDAQTVQAVTDKLIGVDVKTLDERLGQFTYDALEYVNASDWVNNDGGGGKLYIFVEAGETDRGFECEAGSIKIEHYYNTVEQTDEEYEL